MNASTSQSLSMTSDRSRQFQNAVESEPEAPTVPTHNKIAQRAYEIYTRSGSKKGRCEQNWRQAERECL